MAIIGLNCFRGSVQVYEYTCIMTSVQSSGAKRAKEQEVVGVVGIFVTSSAPVTATLKVQQSAFGDG